MGENVKKNSSKFYLKYSKWSPSNSQQLWFFRPGISIFSIFDELSTEMKNKIILSVRSESEKTFSSKFNEFNVKYIEMIHVKFSGTLNFSSWNFNIRWTVYRDEKMTKSQKKFRDGEKFSISVLKHVSRHSESITTKKNWTRIFD